MKTMRKFAVLCAGCLLLTALPLPAAAAEDDPVLTQLAAVKNDKFTVEGKKLGYTALNGECPARPEWYTMPDDSYYEENNAEKYANDDEWWAAQYQSNMSELNRYIEDTGVEAHYAVSNLNGYGIITDGKTDIPLGYNRIVMIDKDGKSRFSTAMKEFNQTEWSFSRNSFSAAAGIFWRGGLGGAHYVNLTTGELCSFPFGNTMHNGYAAVLESLEDGKTFTKAKDLYNTVEVQEEWGTYTGSTPVIIKHQLSLINEKGEKVLTLSEPLELCNGAAAGGDGFSVIGYNYTMNLGGYSEDLIWFSCDRQLGTNLNDLIVNTSEDKDETIMVGPGGAVVGNKYIRSEHECGYADLQGNVVIPQKFDEVYPFHEGIALVGIMEEGSNGWVYKYGFIDKAGNYIVEPQYDSSWDGGTGSFSGGFAKVALQDGTSEEGAPILKYGYIDKTGKVAIELQFEDARDFQNGFACVKKDGKWGYINTAGETVVPFEYTGAYGSDGLSFVVGKEIDGETKFGAIDADGNTILPFVFEDMSNPVNGLVYAFCNKELYSMEIAEILDSGDLTGDGDISIDDAQTALKAYTEKLSGKDSGLTPGQLKAADINGDGQLSVEDVQYILIYYTENKVAGKHMTWEDVLNR